MRKVIILFKNVSICYITEILICTLLITIKMPEKVNHVDDTSVITAKDGNKFLCKLVYVDELEKRVQGTASIFSQGERDKLLERAINNLNRANIEPDFYLEKWPKINGSTLDMKVIHPPYIQLTIEFYQKIAPVADSLKEDLHRPRNNHEGLPY